MVSVTTLPHGRALTYDDLQQMPDDGHRYELVDGTLIVSPSPSWRHQRVVTRLSGLLGAHCPPDLEVFVAPLDVVLALDTVMQPDVLVVRRADLAERDVRTSPLLAVEVLSASTARFDLMLKRSRFEAAGCASYWVIDPDVPSVTAWELQDGAYVEVVRATADQECALQRPFRVAFRPRDLVAD